MAKIQTGQALDLLTLSQVEAKVGDYKWSHLSPIQFNNEHLGTWLLAEGGSTEGTQLEALVGTVTLPDAKTNGAFLRQAKTGRAIGSYEEDQIQGHEHTQNMRNNTAGYWGDNNASPRNDVMSLPTAGIVSDGVNGTPRVGDETRPKNIALNLYIKVSY
jgi:hypothetical protein